MSRFKLLYFVIFIINLCRIHAQISDKRLCVDEECKVPISLARTLLRYSSPDSRILSFAPNVDITIYSKSAGSRVDLWGGEINGKRGYVPKHLVRETRILQKPTLLVDTESNNDTETKQVPSQVEPDKVQEPYEVVDGTTIYLSPQDAINPTSTESPIQSTALPETETASNGITSEVPAKEVTDLPQKQETPTETKQEQTNSSTETNQQVPSNENAIETETAPEKSQGNASDIEEEEDDIEEDDEDEEDDEESEELDAVEDEEPAVIKDAVVETVDLDQTNVTEEIASKSVEDKIESTKEDIKIETAQATENVEQSVIGDQSEKKVEILKPDDSPITTETVEVLDSSNTNSSESLSVAQEEETFKVESTANIKEMEHQNISEEGITFNYEEIEQKIEATTLSPEIEVPNPFDDSLLAVTPNPIEPESQEFTPDPIKPESQESTPDPIKPESQESTLDPIKPESQESKVIENSIPTLPPLGLFSNQNSKVPSSEHLLDNTQISNEESHEAIRNVEEVKVDLVNNQEDTIKLEEINEEKSDFSFTEASTKETNEEESESKENESEERADSGFFSGFMSIFGSNDEDKIEDKVEEEELTSYNVPQLEEEHVAGDDIISKHSTEQNCDATSCQKSETDDSTESSSMEIFNFNSDVFLYLVTTAISVIIFLFGYIAFDKNKREGPLIAKINNLEKELLILLKENQILQEKVSGDFGYDTNDRVSNEAVENLKQDLFELTSLKNALEEQVQSLEKELENSTEVGMELNRMLSEILSSESGSDVLKANVEHLQRQLVEQQATINSVNETLAITNTENHELRLELELSNKKVIDLQTELDKLLLNVLKIEEEKDTQQTSLENDIVTYKQKYEEISSKLKTKEEENTIEIKELKNSLHQTERNLKLKIKEHEVLIDAVKQLKAIKTNDGHTLESLLDVSNIKAELQLLKTENQKFIEKLQQEEVTKLHYEKRAQVAIEEAQRLREKYDESDKLKVETETKLEVLSNYFKDREAQLQKEITKHESLWVEKQGEATSTTERIKFMQEQLQNYKAQTESLKQEIMSQEVELKSQISVLEKKVHENWVSARQAERKLEEAKQEAAQLRHRLTLRERAIQEDKNQHIRYQSPVEQNGDIPVSSLDSPASPPLLYGARDHITKSPPIPGLPPFLPPPPGVPFMPPPLHGVPPFIPPPPTMFPGDHRPPPLGRMSSPPLNSRYSPSSRGYSPYDSSPSDSEYGTSPPQRRGYSPFNSRGEDKRDYKRPPPGRSNGRNIIKDGGSSGSGHSHESLDKITRQQSKV